ncbi:hypothetical protein ONS96_005968 [Cadophora gregata f. sp. sojae]|nr:hypothetical protein ONS96_005968 [Cadophora gregata f. sp. sojae]
MLFAGSAQARFAQASPLNLSKSCGAIAIFAVLCWGTMTLEPRVKWADFNDLPPTLLVEQRHMNPPQPGLRMDMIRRPLSAVFRNLQRSIVSSSRWRQPINSSSSTSTALHVSSLNYVSLKTIGKIHLVWVDNISDHLDFDSANRRLSIFRFPTFCAIACIQPDGTRAEIFQELIRELYSAASDASLSSDCTITQLHQEVLMS